jgi:uncharacterized membrane protein
VWENKAVYPGSIVVTAACYAENAGVKYVYAFEGKASPDYVYRYNIAANTWTNMFNMAVTGTSGLSVVWDRADKIYWLSGGSPPNSTFYAYNISSNTKTGPLAVPPRASSGSTLAYDGGDNIYGLFVNSTTYQSWIYVYKISTNGWTLIDNTPENIGTGGGLIRVGNYLYVASSIFGRTTGHFLRYDLVNAKWDNLASLPNSPTTYWGSGDGLENVGTNYIYANVGSSVQTDFFRFSISDNAWTALQNTPGVQSNAGDRLASDGTYLYLVRAYTDNSFWRYQPPTYGVDVSISPDSQEGLPGQTLTYTVTVTNTGNVTDNFDLTYNDNAGWNPSVSPTVLTGIAPGGFGTATLSVTIPKDAIGCTWDNIWVRATSQGDITKKDNYSVTAHVRLFFEKVCMPDLGQHSRNWCWVAAAANSIYWYSQHGYLELIDDPADPTMNDNRYITDPLIQHPPGCPNGGFYRLLAEIATDCGHVWDEGILDNEYFYGLQKFIDGQGVPLVVHEIVDPAHVSSPPPADGVKVIYRPPTLEDYKRELENCQDVLLWLNYRHTSPYEDTDHVVTGVGFSLDNQWIYVSDPWTPGAPDHSNDLTHTLTPYDYLEVKSTPDAPLMVFYAGQLVQVSKMVYISPAAPPAVCGVEVTIENKLLEGYPSQVLAYTIDVHNSGTVVDNIILSFVPDGWPDITIIPPVLTDVAPCEHRQATMFIHVPDQALPSTYKEITVVAESQFCGATDNDTTQAHVTETPTCGVEVNVGPPMQEGTPSQVLEFTVSVHNSGNVVDNFVLTPLDGQWPTQDIWIVPQRLEGVPPCGIGQATLYVHIPEGTPPSTYKDIIVVAESQFCHATDNDIVTIHVVETPYCGVEVIIENKLLEGYPSQVLAYTIDVHNSGNVVDNIILSYVPDGWPDIWIIPPVLIDVAPCEWRQATMFIHVPDQALPSTYKEITVVAESQFCGATDNDTTLAHVTEIPTCGVEVTIENKLLEGYPSQMLAYTIDVHNSGNIVDNIILSFVPDGWPDIVIIPPVLIDVLPCETRQATMLVHVPDGASPCTYKPIEVIAESMFCHATDSDNAMAHVIEKSENFTLHLVAGWNLVGFQVTNADMTPNNLFAGTAFTMYQWAAPYGPYSEPTKTLPVEDNRGYWVKENMDITITFSGVRPSSRTMYFVAGWNLVSFPLTSANTTPNNLFAGTAFTMYQWAAPYGPYSEPTKTLPVEDNRGYWVKENMNYSVTIPL